MIYLVLSILFSTVLYVIFKLFTRFKINTLHAIIVNYIVALTIGFSVSSIEINPSVIYHSSWFFGALALGFLFIFIFNIMAVTAQRNGLSVVSVASKMSLVIPIIFGVLLYNESLNIVKLIGIILALVAVFLASVKSENNISLKNLFYPVLLFLGSGIIDTSLKYLEINFVSKESIPMFSATIFMFAAFAGLLFALFKRDVKLQWKNLIAGIILGVPNYFSIVFLIKALSVNGIESSTVFTVNNVAIVALSTLIGLIAFKEKLHLKNRIGILLAIISILLVVK